MAEREFRITLTEGKKHQIRRMCTDIGFEVADLKRLRVMNVRIGNLGTGKKREIVGEELKIFLNELGVIK